VGRVLADPECIRGYRVDDGRQLLPLCPVWDPLGSVNQLLDNGPAAVPEPASLALLGSGLFLMGSKVRRRLKNRS
jgi:hypothetical protein